VWEKVWEKVWEEVWEEVWEINSRLLCASPYEKGVWCVYAAAMGRSTRGLWVR
jgi:hypothetical protein